MVFQFEFVVQCVCVDGVCYCFGRVEEFVNVKEVDEGGIVVY